MGVEQFVYQPINGLKGAKKTEGNGTVGHYSLGVCHYK